MLAGSCKHYTVFLYSVLTAGPSSCCTTLPASFARAVQVQQSQRDTIGPPKAVLKRIFTTAATARARSLYHVFFDQLLVRRVDALHIGQRARANLLCVL